jgi:hypothetical protein
VVRSGLDAAVNLLAEKAQITLRDNTGMSLEVATEKVADSIKEIGFGAEQLVQVRTPNQL